MLDKLFSLDCMICYGSDTEREKEIGGFFIFCLVFCFPSETLSTTGLITQLNLTTI